MKREHEPLQLQTQVHVKAPGRRMLKLARMQQATSPHHNAELPGPHPSPHAMAKHSVIFSIIPRVTRGSYRYSICFSLSPARYPLSSLCAKVARHPIVPKRTLSWRPDCRGGSVVTSFTRSQALPPRRKRRSDVTDPPPARADARSEMKERPRLAAEKPPNL